MSHDSDTDDYVESTSSASAVYADPVMDRTRNALFCCDLYDGYSFRQLLEFYRNFSSELCIQACPFGLKIESSDTTRSIIAVAEIYKYNITNYVYESEAAYIPIGLNIEVVKEMAKSISRKDCVRLMIDRPKKGMKEKDISQFIFCKLIGKEVRDNSKIQINRTIIPTSHEMTDLITKSIKDPDFVIQATEFATLCSTVSKCRSNHICFAFYENGVSVSTPERTNLVNHDGFRGKYDKDMKLLAKIHVNSNIARTLSKVSTLSTNGQVRFYIQTGQHQPIVRLVLNVGHIGSLSIYIQNHDQDSQ